MEIRRVNGATAMGVAKALAELAGLSGKSEIAVRENGSNAWTHNSSCVCCTPLGTDRVAFTVTQLYKKHPSLPGYHQTINFLIEYSIPRLADKIKKLGEKWDPY